MPGGVDFSSRATSGLGGLSVLKNIINQTASGGFYTELPDVIYSRANNTYDGVYRLHWVNPDTSNANGTAWELIYRAEAFDGPQDYWIGFRLDPDGTNVTPSVSKAVGISKSENLRWFIENGRAVYYNANFSSGSEGGGSSVNDISGLIRHYNLDGNLTDATLTTDLTSTGDALNWEYGKFNQAVKLNGTNNKLRTGLVMPSTSSISLWYKHNDKTGGNDLYIFGDFDASGVNASGSVSLRLTPTNTLNILTSGGVQETTPSSHSVWHHTVLTRSGGAWKLYLDGTEVHSGTSASAQNALVFAYWTSANLSNASPKFFGGWLDNIRIYNKELTASEVTTLYNQ